MAKEQDENDIVVRQGRGALRRRMDTSVAIKEPEKVLNGHDATALVNVSDADRALAVYRSRAFNPANWEGKRAPPSKWIIQDYIPDLTVTLLYADGGTGKSYLKLQLAVARATGREWIGLMPEPGRTLVVSTEDDLDEIWRRIEGMLESEGGPFAGARMADLGDIRLVDLVGEQAVLGLLMRGIVEPTAMYLALDAYVGEFEPGLVCLDVLADLFAGEEIMRTQVTQFIGLLKRLCRNHNCAVLLLAHPSVTGMGSGSGTSGSTAWHNAARSRLYFQRVVNEEGSEPNRHLRTFEGKKSNYSERGGRFDVEWRNGMFCRIRDGLQLSVTKEAIEQRFLAMLKARNEQERPVSDKIGANYAPTVFSREPDMIAAGITMKRLEEAMERLFKFGRIVVDLIGPPSRQTRSIKEAIMDELFDMEASD